MGALQIPIDPQRLQFPISGSQLRADLKTHWQMLTPPAKAYLAKRVCVLGVESSGTTTLAQALAESYHTVKVSHEFFQSRLLLLPTRDSCRSIDFGIGYCTVEKWLGVVLH